MIENIVINGEELINVPSNLDILIELGLSESDAIKAIEDSEGLAKLQALRAAREALLPEADYLVNIALDNEMDITPFRAYRQQLRDITKHYQSLDDVVWPEKPAI